MTKTEENEAAKKRKPNGGESALSVGKLEGNQFVSKLTLKQRDRLRLT
jgi:hypothetical protein